MPSSLLRVGAVFVALVSLAASATIVAFETIDEMARRVPVIVRGRVARTVSGWDDQKRRIWTWTEVVVSDAIKGKPGAVVLVKQPGGEVDGIGQAVAGTATFHEGEDCVLFLEPAPDEPTTFRVSGLSAGKVLLTQWRGQSAAVRDTEGISFAAPAGRKVSVVKSPEMLGSPTDFVAHLRSVSGGAR
jgi:hypothetical protein